MLDRCSVFLRKERRCNIGQCRRQLGWCQVIFLGCDLHRMLMCGLETISGTLERAGGRCRSSYKVFSDLLRKQYTKQQNNGP